MPWICDLAARLLRRRRPEPVAAPEVPAAAPVRFRAGGLLVTVTCQGSRSARGRRAQVVHLVSVEAADGGPGWTARYGFEVGDHDPRRAAAAALDELERAAGDANAWRQEWTEGMSEREAEALLGGPDLRGTAPAAAWAGPLLAAARDGAEWRLEPEPIAAEGAPSAPPYDGRAAG